MKIAVIINDGTLANLIEASSTAEAIEKEMRHCIIHNIIVNKVIAYHSIEL